ncbi:MAG: TetR family transcriptional regulator [Alphaproteobacteria bacterium]|nr:TetR family transcriptional regulator [Alphaproteobacteria bacterium]
MAQAPDSEPARPGAPRYSRKQAPERKRLLIEAAVACLAEGGIAGFTVERICKKAGISKGLISHHFDGKEDLLAQTYEAMTANLDGLGAAQIGRENVSPRQALRDFVAANFDPKVFDRTQLKAWLAVWGETASNPKLAAIHKARYVVYHDRLSALISAIATEDGRQVDAGLLATMLISLIDGLWLEWCLDEKILPRQKALSAVYHLLEPHLGALQP